MRISSTKAKEKTKRGIALMDEQSCLTFPRKGKLRERVIWVTGINFSLPPAQLAVSNCDDLIPPNLDFS